MQKEYLTNLFSLEGKVALVTGAGRGIGQVIARDLARAGADIAIFSRSGAAESVKLIESEGGKIRYRQNRELTFLLLTIEQTVQKLFLQFYYQKYT